MLGYCCVEDTKRIEPIVFVCGDFCFPLLAFKVKGQFIEAMHVDGW